MKKAITILCLCLLSNGCNFTSSPPYSTPLLIGQKKIFVEIVNTPEKMAQGLSDRERLTDKQGMLFDFSNVRSKTKSSPSTPSTDAQGREPSRTTSSGQNAGLPAFWMKGMKFDLDLIWIKDKKIIGITQNVPVPKPPDEKLKLYSPPSEVDMVLEVNAGWCERNEIKVGDEIKFKSK